jgi:cytochrome P450
LVEINVTGGQRYLFTREPEHIKTILTGKFADYGKGEEFHRVWEPFLGDSIFTTDGQKWQDSRNLIRPMVCNNIFDCLAHVECVSVYEESSERPTHI